MTHDFDPWLFRRGGNRNRNLAFAIAIFASLSVPAIQADAGGFKNGATRGGFHESATRAAEADAGPAGGLASNSIDSNGLIGLLKNKSVSVWPPNANEELRSTKLDGGYTIKTFGSTQFNEGLVAIQCEVILALRDDEQKRQQFAGVMAECIWNFVEPFS